MGLTPSPVNEPVPVPNRTRESDGWLRKAAALLYIFFCFEVGAFLVLFPWVLLWEQNHLVDMVRADWRWIWYSTYFRGAVSGLGLVNIWIAFSELFRLWRPEPDRHGQDHPLE